MLISVLQLFISLYIALEVKPGKQSLENGQSRIFQAIGNIILQRCRASMTKHRQQSTKVRAKGIHPMWGQVCFSLLQFHFLFYLCFLIVHWISLRGLFWILCQTAHRSSFLQGQLLKLCSFPLVASGRLDSSWSLHWFLCIWGLLLQPFSAVEWSYWLVPFPCGL